MTIHTQEYATRSLLVREQIALHQLWIEQKLGTTLSETVLIDGLPNLSQVGVHKFLQIPEQQRIWNRVAARLMPLVANAEVPPNFPPMLELPDDSDHDFEFGSQLEKHASRVAKFKWHEGPLALRLHVYNCTIVVLNVSYHSGPASADEQTRGILISRRDSVPTVLRLFEDIYRKDHTPHLYTLNGRPRRVARIDWADLTLDSNVKVLLQNDFESFWQREDWFKEHPNLPFRRGYLLHGPPGNGKTTAIRAMMSSRGLNAFTLRFFNPHTDDGDLDALFDRAYRDRPAMILLEDIDRAFPRTGESRTQISLQHLLNSLDGIATGEGLVIAATANEPAALDPAILRRPGRFDRVVHFSNPDDDLRLEYLLKMHSQFMPDQLREAVGASSGFSFAQLREAYVLAGQFAFERGGDIRGEDLLAGVSALREGVASGSRYRTSAGFHAPDGPQ